MNEDLNYDTGNGLGRNAKIAIGVVVGLVLVALAVGAVLFIRSRATAGGPVATPQPAVNGAVNGDAMVAPTQKSPQEQLWDTELKAAQQYNVDNASKSDDGGIKYDTELKMTPDEKVQLGYPFNADVRYKYVKLDTGGYTKIITKAPAPSEPLPHAPVTSKKPASAPSVNPPLETAPETPSP